MSISKHNGCRDLLVRALRVLDVCMPELRVCELGDQRVRDMRKYVGPSKDYFEFFGAHYISIDLNGRCGAVPLDLTKPFEDNHGWYDSFHLVTNFGTTEHVSDQKAVFSNIHHLCKIRGVMVHHVPLIGTDHGDYGYSTEWFKEFATDHQYLPIYIEPFAASIKEGNTYVQAVLLKTKESVSFSAAPFRSPEKRSNGDVVTTSERDNVRTESRGLGQTDSSPHAPIVG